jgi:hypothetical protein
MADLYALYRLALEGAGYKVAWSEFAWIETANGACASAGFRASRTRVEPPTSGFWSCAAARGTGAPSAGRGKDRPTGPFTTTGIGILRTRRLPFDLLPPTPYPLLPNANGLYSNETPMGELLRSPFALPPCLLQDPGRTLSGRSS